MRTYWIAAIPGDGIGKEVIPFGIEVLKALAERERDFALLIDVLPWGADYYRSTDRFMPEDGIATLRQYDAIYFGAFGDPRIPDHVIVWGWWLPVCRALDHNASVQPIRILPGIRGPLHDRGPGDLDWVLVRENGQEEFANDRGRPRSGAFTSEDAVFSRAGVFQIMRFAFQLARSRPRQHLTVVTESKTDPRNMVMWNRVSAATKHEFPEVTLDTEPFDAVTSRMVQRPQTLDTMIAVGSHADVLDDLGVALAGGRGLLPSANLDPSRRSPSMFRPAHGPAFEITGRGTANPIAAFWAGALMLEHLGERDAAIRLSAAVEHVTGAGAPLTPDIGGTATTREVADAVIGALKNRSD